MTASLFALGSRLVHPSIPGLAEHSFNIDTFDAARRLMAHVDGLSSLTSQDGRFTALVVGSRLQLKCPHGCVRRPLAREVQRARPVRAILADRTPRIADAMGGAQPVIEKALSQLGVELRPEFALKSIDSSGVVLASGERLAACTVVWCGGMHAHPLTQGFPVALDPLGRVPVDAFMRVNHVPGVFAAGDSACVMIDGARPSVMSCQHARPMGRYAGYNVVCDLLGLEMRPLYIDWYTTILDLGPWGAVYTEDWERRLVAQGDGAKKTKLMINHDRISPPWSGNKQEVLAAAAAEAQGRPAVFSS